MGLRIDSVVHLLPFVKSSHTTSGEEIVVHELVITESWELGDEFVSTDEVLGCENVGLEHPEESVLNDDPVGDINVDDSDDSEPILQFNELSPH